MGTFQASGVVRVNGRAAADVVVSFAVGDKVSPTRRRLVPAAVRTDKVGRFVQTGFSDGGLDRAGYRITPRKRGATFDPPSRDVCFPRTRCPSSWRRSLGGRTSSSPAKC